MAYSERLPTRLNPLAERTCFSQELLGDPRFEHVLPGTPAEHARKINMDHDNTHFTAPFDPANKEGFVGKQGGAATFNQTETWTPGGLCRGGIHGGGRRNHI